MDQDIKTFYIRMLSTKQEKIGKVLGTEEFLSHNLPESDEITYCFQVHYEVYLGEKEYPQTMFLETPATKVKLNTKLAWWIMKIFRMHW